MSIIICPGIHEPGLTENFISECLFSAPDSCKPQNSGKILVFPGDGLLVLSSVHILQFLGDRLRNDLKSPVTFISFSAGVVGAIGAACSWQLLGGNIKAFIAIDGWGVPLWGNFPIHRMSHDYFTHWSSSLSGGRHDNFYADPAVNHLSMWRAPQTVKGWWIHSSVKASQPPVTLTAAEFLQLLIKRYEQ
ncbi:hypothetical protein NWP22_10480 [Anabaenopsis tanganyikae CS-531]|uniref:Uncharacterized protein n=2 Tax=Anabaenopsis TaxID=110103 RepID=A0ABT5ASN0_9CYAN|nr:MULTISPECIES: hypothetical protein [Anabaenopsis]MDB9540323.1 hypothetical protein [Anabaenopsis arnoldii]MDH6092721.1 hypothetical protein [Anabaenopsis arnoldii]MDH6098885.1 hypothetical protein [Anabaenopsis sp. FSS-46]MDH6106286.1 hypothetical protein [Anabaenopsis tanganyikae CS-531]